MKNKLLLSVAFLEGATLMSTEILGAKLLAPFLGTSLFVWASVFISTFIGMACGYFIGGKISLGKNSGKQLILILLFSSIYLLNYSSLSSLIASIVQDFDLIPASLIASTLLIFPLMFCFGLVSPIIIKSITKNVSNTGFNAGIVYTISTIGGIISTFIFGLYLIPNYGTKASILISFFILFIALLVQLSNLILYKDEK